MTSRWPRAAGALVLLVALLVGVPLILIRIAGWPLPSKVPDWSHMVTMVRQGDIRAEAVTKSVAAVVWIAWLQSAWATMWELVVNVPAQSSGRRAPTPAPLVAPAVSVGVGRLVAAILAIGLAVGSVSPVAAARPPGLLTLVRSASSDAVAAAVVEPLRRAAPSVVSVTSAQRVSQATWVVGDADTLWGIATVALGDGSHVEQILELNPTLVSARHLRQGQRLRLPRGAEVPSNRSPAPVSAPDAQVDVADVPDDARHLVVVQPGDNLWGLIDAVVDTPTAADVASVAEANDGATTAAGPWAFHAEHPELIHPGQTFDLDPAVARHPLDAGRGTGVADVDEPPSDAPDAPAPVDPTVDVPTPDVRATPVLDTPPTTVAVSVASPPTSADAPATSVVGQVPPATSAPAVRPAPAVPGTTAPAASAPGSLRPAEPTGAIVDTSTDDGVPVGALGVAALVAAGAIALLDARRRRALRSAAVGARLAVPRDRDVQTERTLRALDESERLVRLDLAVRACALDLADAGARLLTAHVSAAGEIHLVTDRPATPSGGVWRIDLDDGSWVLPAGAPTASLADGARHAGMACPALVHLGRSGEGHLYVDLEAIGALVVETDHATGIDIVRSLAASVALSPFAMTAHLISVGIDADLDVESGVVVHQADTLDEALVLAEHALGSTRALGRDTTTFALRARSNGGEEWEPAVVFAAIDGGPVDVSALGDRVGAGLAVVLAVTRTEGPVGPPDSEPGGSRLSVHPTAAGEASEPVQPSGSAAVGVTASAIWRLRGAADSFVLEPLGVTVDPCRLSNAALVDVDYLLSSTEEVFAPSGSDAGESVGPRSIGPLVDVFGPDEAEAITPPVGASEAEGNADPDETQAQARSAGPSATYADPRWGLMVRLLGPVEVVASDGTAVSFERSKALELVVWLSQHRQRPTRGGARTALWDLDVRDSTFANVVSDARRALGRAVEPPVGEEWLLRTLTEQLPLHDGVLSDADVLTCRCAHARRLTDPADAIGVLRPGLELVTGMPFAGTSYLWPDAEGITSSLTLLVVGAATELANRYLQLGDSEGVFWATGQGLKVLAGHEELIALRMRAHHRAGDLAGVRHEWETYERALDADPWSPAHPSPKLVDLRRELLTAAS